jgi:hypothetical protein
MCGAEVVSAFSGYSVQVKRGDSGIHIQWSLEQMNGMIDQAIGWIGNHFPKTRSGLDVSHSCRPE